MKKYLLLLIITFLMACSNVKPEPKVGPFKEGDIAYRKIDSSKVIILLDLGKFDANVYLYRIQYKDSNKISSGYALSSSLFKK